MPKRPAPVDVGEIRARAVRARGARGPHDDRWYWRAEVKRTMVWRGWATRSELPRILAGVLLQAPKSPSVGDVQTVRQLLEMWLGTSIMARCDLSTATQRTYQSAAQRLADSIGDCRLTAVDRIILDRWAGRQARSFASSTVRLDRRVLGVAWGWGREVGICRDSLPRPGRAGRATPAPRTPTLDEVLRILDVLDAERKPWTGLAVRLLLAWGCRVGELAALTWAQVDLGAGLVELDGKTGPRVVPCTPEVVALLTDWPRPRTWVLGLTPGSARVALGQHINRAADQLGIERFTTHGLRRLAVDRMARAGVDVGTAAALLGHSPEVMLRIYRQVSVEDRRAGVAALGVPRGEVVPLRREGRD